MNTTIEIPANIASVMQAHLDTGKQFAGQGVESTGVVMTWTGHFEDAAEVDVKVCNVGNGERPFVDVILYSPDGVEIAVGEPSYTLLGEAIMECEGRTYTVNVKEAD